MDNPGFDIDINFVSSSAAATSAATVYPVYGWEPTVGSNCTGATIGYGYSESINGGNATMPTSNADGTSVGGALAICVGWNNTVTYKSLKKTFIAGSYRITYRTYNGNTKNTTALEAIPLVGFIPTEEEAKINSSTESFANQAWSTHSYAFNLAENTEGQIQIGLQPTSSTYSYNAPEIFVDEIKLEYFNPLTLAQIQWQEVHNVLEALDATALPDAAEAAITTELAKSVPTTSVDDVNTAKAALQALIDSYNGIKTAYNKLQSLITFATEEKTNSTGEKTAFETAISTANSTIETRTTAEALAEDYNTLETARQTYVTSGAQPTADHVFDFTFKINDAAVTGTSAWGTARVATNEQYTGAPDNTYMDVGWAQTYNMNQSVASLPAGYYTLKAATRAKSSEVTSANIYVNQANTALNRSTNNNRNNNAGGELGNGWGWTNVEFKLQQTGDVTVGFYAQTTGQGWAGADDFHLYYNGAKTLLQDTINVAKSIYNNGANVGTGVFQIPSAAGTAFATAISNAENALSSVETLTDVFNAISNLQTAETTYANAELNAPAADTRYYLTVATSGHDKENNAVVVDLGDQSANNKTGYTFKANASPAAHSAGAYIFTKVKGNTYNISVERPEGTVYLTYGSLNGSAASWATSQIQATTVAENKGTFKIAATSTPNVFNIYNTVTSTTIACQSGGNIYTELGNADFAVSVATQATVNVTIAAGKYATRIFPFVPTLPTGVKAYTCEEVSGSTLTLVEVAEPHANVPYILYSEDDCASTDLTGWGTAAADSYPAGLLTGVYTDAAISASAGNTTNYVLQTQDDTQAFYKVESDFKATPYRAYLTVTESEAKAFYFNSDEANAIETISALTSDTVEGIYTAGGVKLNSLQKGLNIVKMQNGETKKVLVK